MNIYEKSIVQIGQKGVKLLPTTKNPTYDRNPLRKSPPKRKKKDSQPTGKGSKLCMSSYH